MYKKVFFFLILSLSLPVGAVAEDVVCEGHEQCQEFWWRAQTWLKENARFKIRQINENKVEAKTRSNAHKSRLEYTLTRSQEGISLEGSCKSSIGCPSIERKKKAFSLYVTQVQKVDSADSGNIDPRDAWINAHCDEHVASYELRVSWLGQLYEEECADGEGRSLHVLRCTSQDCVELKP